LVLAVFAAACFFVERRLDDFFRLLSVLPPGDRFL
jgi:hypothetical protein